MTTRTWVLALATASLLFSGAILFHQGSKGRSRPPLIPAASAQEVLRYVREGKRVVFVDARESAEFREERIPGAINLTLREVRSLDPAELGDPALVIAYCIKDLRGYEVARALDHAGVRNVHTFAEIGFQGWKKLGLPTEKGAPVVSAAPSRVLAACAADVEQCTGRSRT